MEIVMRIIVCVSLVVTGMITGMIIGYIIYGIVHNLKNMKKPKEDIEEFRNKVKSTDGSYFIFKFYTNNIKYLENNKNKLYRILFRFFSQRVVDFNMDMMQYQFAGGYCWHFAHMMKLSYDRGTVFWEVPYSHFVWYDDKDDEYFDITGKREKDSFSILIPEEYIPDGILNRYKHNNQDYTGTIDEYMAVVDKYTEEKGIKYNREFVQDIITRACIDHQVVHSISDIKSKVLISE